MPCTRTRGRRAQHAGQTRLSESRHGRSGRAEHGQGRRPLRREIGGRSGTSRRQEEAEPVLTEKERKKSSRAGTKAGKPEDDRRSLPERGAGGKSTRSVSCPYSSAISSRKSRTDIRITHIMISRSFTNA